MNTILIFLLAVLIIGTLIYLSRSSSESTKITVKPSSVIKTSATTQPPVITTQPPVETTQPPVITTQPPVETTQPPVIMTQPPVETTQPPVKTWVYKGTMNSTWGEPSSARGRSQSNIDLAKQYCISINNNALAYYPITKWVNCFNTNTNEASVWSHSPADLYKFE